MNTIKLLIAVAGVAVFLTACDTKDPIYITDHPEKGEVSVTADWSNLGEGITKPSGYTIALDGKAFQATNDSYTLTDLIDPGSYALYLYNTAEQITVNGTVATVSASASGVSPEPGWFFSGKSEVTIEKDTKQEFTVAMQQQVRELTLLLNLTGGTAHKVTSVTATLSGVAGSYDMETDTYGTASEVALTFVKETDGKWKATIRLLGITGPNQRLTGSIAFEGGSPTDIPLESDLTEILKSFNDLKKEPLVLSGQTAETPSETGFTATITDWEKEQGGSEIAN